ncbi:MAG: hypothetical protein WEC59_05375, partial [Salibacteraceae bacterium]
IFPNQCIFHPFNGGHPAIPVAQQANKKRPATAYFVKADFQHIGFTFIFLRYGGGIHAPAEVNNFELDTSLLEFFFYTWKNNVFQIVPLRLHIGKGAADKNGEGAPGYGFFYFWDIGIRTGLNFFWFTCFRLLPGTWVLGMA